MSVADLSSIFKQWWSQEGLTTKTGGTPSINTQDVYQVAAKHVGVMVERDGRVDYMYGVQPVTSTRHNGAHDIVYERG